MALFWSWYARLVPASSHSVFLARARNHTHINPKLQPSKPHPAVSASTQRHTMAQYSLGTGVLAALSFSGRANAYRTYPTYSPTTETYLPTTKLTTDTCTSTPDI